MGCPADPAVAFGSQAPNGLRPDRELTINIPVTAGSPAPRAILRGREAIGA
jgi:hypothetical protein